MSAQTMVPPSQCNQEWVNLADSLTIGRAVDNKLQLTDPAVSRHHAVIEWSDNGGYVLRDVQSRIGTLVNGRLCDRHLLVFGDRLQIGPFLYRFSGDRIERVRDARGGTVEAINLTRRFGTKTTLSNVNIRIPAGQFVGIVGTSGAGKSTLLDALSGMRIPSEGTVLIDGKDLYRQRWNSAPSGYVPQDDIVHRELKTRDALFFSAWLRLPGNVASFEIRKLVDSVITRLGLSERAALPVDRLSGGQRKRVSIGAELLSRPRVLFLDEPSSGLDPSTEAKLMELLRELSNTGCTTICTTHVMENVFLMDQVAVVFGGRLVFFGSPQAALKHFNIPRFTALYDRLEERDAADWDKEFQVSTGKESVESKAPAIANEPDTASQRPPFFKILWARHIALLRAETKSVAMLIGQPVLIGMLAAWMADSSHLKLFLAYLATLWFGCSNAAQEIVKEVPIYRRERLVGLPRLPYLLTKVLFLGVATSLQAVVLFVCIHFGHNALEGAALWQLSCLIGIAWASIAIGLTISALVRTTTQAVLLVPLILLPQIIFSGYVLPSLATGSGPKKHVTDAMPSFAAQQLMDVSLLWNHELTPQFTAGNFAYLRVDPKQKLTPGQRYREFTVGATCLLKLLAWTVGATLIANFGLKLRESSS